MNKLEQVLVKFKEYRKWAYDSVTAAEYAVERVFEDETPPSIHLDNYGLASHIFWDGNVLFFNDGIYRKHE